MKIKIENPCSENWTSMHNSKQGRFCDTCQKEVVDFSKFTDAELKEVFAKSQGTGCGRFRLDQLNRTLVEPTSTQKNITNKWWLSFALLLSGCSTSVQNQKNTTTEKSKFDKTKSFVFTEPKIPVKITGIVQNEYRKRILEGVSVHIKGTDARATTDENGEFTIQTTLPNDTTQRITLVFEYGEDYETREEALAWQDFDKKKVFYIELNKELLKKGAYAIIERKSLWQKICGVLGFKRHQRQV